MTENTISREPRRIRAAAVVGTAGLLGIALGTGGASLALWSDQEEFTGEIASGYEYFAAGHLDDTEAAPSGSVSTTIGAEEAATLVENEEIAIPLQTDSLSQGNKGLTYQIAEPDWGEGIFGAAEVTIFPVETAEECTADNTQEQPEELSSTPVSSDYSDSEELTEEHWCLTASLEGLPGEGTYQNIGTVTADDPRGEPVTDDDDWDAVVGSDLDPEDEADHAIEFSYETFRAGEQTP